MPIPEPPSRPLRKDAERSRRRVLEAAATVFAAKGLDAGFDEIARVAGVGVGTVYRRFPQKDELIEAVLTSKIQRVVDLAGEALHRPDTWEALTWFFEQFLLEQRHDAGLAQLVARGEMSSPRLTSQRDDLADAVTRVVERAQRDGTARADLDPLDFVVVQTMIVRMAAADDSEMWRRYFDLLLDGLRCEPLRAAPTGDEPTVEVVEKLLRRL